MSLSDPLDSLPAFVALAALLGYALLIPLYLSQRRDVHRLRDWMEREPEHPAHDLAASEEILDRAEAELERLRPEPATGVTPAPGTTPVPASAAAARVTSERPALERITMERAALQPHSRWRGFTARVTQPRALIAIGVAAVLLGAAAIFGSERLLSGDDDSGRARGGGAIDPSEVEVVVLNGTSTPGLAGNVGSDLESSDYVVLDATNATEAYEQTIVMYADGQKPAAQKIARLLGVRALQEMDRDTRRLANEADVVVIAGEDRARS